MKIKEYFKQLNREEIPTFLLKYLQCPSLLRLQKIGFFCGMDYASKEIYPFEEWISRYHHSLSCALLTWNLTHDKIETLAALFHDISTPCFSHVIDYMNQDYLNQESTEEYTEKMMKRDLYLQKCLEEEQIALEDVANFKKYSIVDSKRPKLCMDRMDGIILGSIGWTKSLTKEDLKKILADLKVYQNEDQEQEIGFQSIDICQTVINLEAKINTLCHSQEDNYMMMLLANMTKYAIGKGYISYKDLYQYQEEELFSIFQKIPDILFQERLQEFTSISKEQIPVCEYPPIKERKIRPLVKGIRI